MTSMMFVAQAEGPWREHLRESGRITGFSAWDGVRKPKFPHVLERCSKV